MTIKNLCGKIFVIARRPKPTKQSRKIAFKNNMMNERIKPQETKNTSNGILQIPGHGEVRIRKRKKGINSIKCIDSRPIKEISSEENALSIQNEHRNRMPENYESAAAIPGGSLGLAMIAKEVFPDLSPREAVNLIIDWSKYMNIPVSIHKHCGHLDLASKNAGLYGMKNDDMEKMSDYLRSKADKGDLIITETNLKEKHNEKYVQIITTDENNPKTVEQIDSNGNRSFRIDKTVNKKILKSLASYIIEQNRKEVSGKVIQDTKEELYDKLYKSYNTHLNITLGELGPNLPIFELNFREDVATVTPKGRVKPFPQRA